MAEEYQRNLGDLGYQDPNHLHEIEEIRSEKMPENFDKQAQHDILGKLIIIGDTGVGKSCLMKRVMDNEFKQEH